jgi:hypothetical protein
MNLVKFKKIQIHVRHVHHAQDVRNQVLNAKKFLIIVQLIMISQMLY